MFPQQKQPDAKLAHGFHVTQHLLGLTAAPEGLEGRSLPPPSNREPLLWSCQGLNPRLPACKAYALLHSQTTNLQKGLLEQGKSMV